MVHNIMTKFAIIFCVLGSVSLILSFWFEVLFFISLGLYGACFCLIVAIPFVDVFDY